MTKHQRFVNLSWILLEHKCRYYILNKPTVQDYEYDLLEKEYDALAQELGLPNSVGDMVDFDTSRPACQLVMEKLNVIKRPDTRVRRKNKAAT